MQAIRVADDVSHFNDAEKCKPCYHHRLLKSDIQPQQNDYTLSNTVTELV